MASDEYGSDGHRERPDGGFDVDPNHPALLADPRWKYARSHHALAHAAAANPAGEDAPSGL